MAHFGVLLFTYCTLWWYGYSGGLKEVNSAVSLFLVVVLASVGGQSLCEGRV